MLGSSYIQITTITGWGVLVTDVSCGSKQYPGCVPFVAGQTQQNKVNAPQTPQGGSTQSSFKLLSMGFHMVVLNVGSHFGTPTI